MDGRPSLSTLKWVAEASPDSPRDLWTARPKSLKSIREAAEKALVEVGSRELPERKSGSDNLGDGV